MKEKEIWKAIPGFEGYEASNLGKIRSLKFGKVKVLKPRITRRYYDVTLYKDGKIKRPLVQRLIYSAFNGIIPDGMTVDHINGIKTDNRIENLQLLTRGDNVRKANKGKKLSEEHKAKLSAVKKGKPSWNKGKKRTQETKAKISAAKKGKTTWNKGKKLSEEHKAKISKSLKARKV